MTVRRSRIACPCAPATPALTIRRYIDLALICSACCR
ncbi:hypothetical protein FB465_5795 [Kitasatospora atroaurantiaca]|uniref:Uncharacterized protein n=1 Tax=Kitasatospora atroaurantiaca TaxID=285545 RepID=A0A561EYF5_9ACTN|nr:hypothetical protein FB465_5795 [Kitasatospora atroaurantiaca]